MLSFPVLRKKPSSSRPLAPSTLPYIFLYASTVPTMIGLELFVVPLVLIDLPKIPLMPRRSSWLAVYTGLAVESFNATTDDGRKL